MTPKTENLFVKIEKSHDDLLKRIDKLDKQVEEVLKNWTDLSAVGNLSDTEPDLSPKAESTPNPRPE